LLWRFSLSDILSRGKLKSYNAGINGEMELLNYLEDKYSSELLKHFNDWSISKSSVSVAEEALAFANESMGQTIARQALRTAKPFEVYQAQEYLLRAQMDYFESVYDNNLSYYKLKLALGNSF
jgi:outer membrane protein TolC